MQIRGCRRATFAVSFPAVELRHLVEAGALLLGPAEIIVGADLQLICGRDEGAGNGPRTFLVRDLEGTGIAVEFIGPALVALRTFEIGQDLPIGPAVATEVRPVVIVGCVPPGIEHCIDGA